MGGPLCSPISLFDLCLAGFLVTPFIQDPTKQEIYFVFYIIFLVCISIGLKPMRSYRSIPLMFLTLWAFAGIFIHSFIIPCEESIVRRYISMYLMSEGFIYILFGSLFISIVVKHSKNIRIFYLLIPISMIPLLQKAAIGVSMTFVFSIAVSVIIYLFIKKGNLLLIPNFIWGFLLIGISSIFALINWPYIMMKWTARPYVWKQLIKEIIEHPFVGSGFYHGLGHPDHMIDVEIYGWLWRHNDWLSLGAYLGAAALIFIVWFYSKSIRKIGIRPALIPMLIIGIMSCFQITMFSYDKASVYLLMGALCISQSYKKEEL